MLMKVVFPSPDSPATCPVSICTLVHIIYIAYHNGEGCTSLRNDLVTLVWLPPCQWEKSKNLGKKLTRFAIPIGDALSAVGGAMTTVCGGRR